MPDVGIGIGVTGGKDAKEFVDALTQSLRLLGQQGHAQAIETRRAALAAREYANALISQSQSAKQNVQTERERLVAIRAAATESIALSRKERAEAIETAKTYARSVNEATRALQKLAEARVAAAKAADAPTRDPASGRFISRAAGGQLQQATISARAAELRTANENAARGAALGRQRIAQAQQVGVAEEKAALKTVAAQNKVIVGANKVATAQAQAAATANRAAAVAQRAAQSAATAFKNQSVQAGNLSSAMTRLRTTVLQLAASYVGIRTLFGAIRTGLEFNQIIESSTLGIAALITAEAKLEDQHGRLLTGTEALKSAQILAKDQLDKLRIAGIQTAATTEDLVRAFQEAVGAGVAVGLTLDQIRVFTVQVAQAAGAINLPFNQLNQEVRSILQGTIDRNSRIAKALQLTNEQVRLAKEEGRLADLLNEKFRAFNIAGVEVVKTFSGLKSTIKDAFQVLSGRAVEPLFEQIRIAGLKALSSIFDFRSAEVQASFQGLIRGAQVIFGEIGKLFAQALGNAVNRAEALSLWLDRNRQEVKETASAIRSMVESFGEMIVSIGRAVLGLGELAGGTNAVVKIAHTLNALFQAIADNAKLIVLLLTGRALITTLGSIVSMIVAISGRAAGVTLGAAVGTALGGPGLGTAIGGVIGLLVGGIAAMKIFRQSEQQTAIETGRLTSELDDQKTEAAGLVAQYLDLTRQLQDTSLNEDQRNTLLARLAEVTRQFNTGAGKDYLDLINKTKEGTKEQRRALLELLQAKTRDAQLTQQRARLQVTGLEAQLSAAEKTSQILIPRQIAKERVIFEPDPDAIKRVQELRKELELANGVLERETTNAEAFGVALTKATELPPKITREGDPNAPGGGEPAFIKQARARLERLKAQLDAERAEIDAAFSRGSITAVEHIVRLGEVDRAEIDAEEKFLEAQRREAERKVEVAEKSKSKNRDERIKMALDALKAIDIQEVIFSAKRDKQRADEAAAILEVTRETAQAKEAIEIRFLEATGQHLEAARREIENKNAETIREAIREFGSAIPEELRQKLLDANGPELGRLLTEFSKDLPPVLLRLRTALDHEALEAQVKEIKTEIERITQQRSAEIANIMARFGRSEKLSSAEKQEKADLIAQANLKASLSANKLRQDLEAMRKAAAADPTLVTFIDGLIASLDTLQEKAIEVDQEMERLKDGVRQAFENNIGTFFEGFIDKTKKVSDAFADMVKGIINEVNRLIAHLLAQKITDALFKLLGIVVSAGVSSSAGAGGQTPGNTTPSGGRAQGGPARPSYGKLQGGIRGRDTIPILAQADEWFLRPSVRRKYGDDFLWALNNLDLPKIDFRRWPKFALGGPVGPTRLNGAATENERTVTLRGRIDINEQGLITFVQGPVFGQAVRNHVKTAPREVSGALNIRQRRP